MIPLRIEWPSLVAYVAAHTAEISRNGLLVRGATAANAMAGAEVELTLVIGPDEPIVVSARIAAVIPGVGVAVMFDATARETLDVLCMPPVDLEGPTVDAPLRPGPLSERMKEMSTNEKMQLALSGTRDERAAVLRDTNKTLHLFVMKNPRLGLDEVQAAAKMPQLSPDALKFIAEHREWGNNANVCAALVRNPKTPMPLALRMLERVPMTDLKAIAKGGARDALVHAARKKLG